MSNLLPKASVIIMLIAVILTILLPHFPNVSYAQEEVQSQSSVVEPEARSEVGNKIIEKVIQLFFLTLFVLSIVGVLLGVTDKAVFYADGRDVIESFLPFVVPIAVAILLAIVGAIFEFGDWYGTFVGGVSLIIAIACIAYVYNKALNYNAGSKFKALSVTIGKMLLSFMCIFMFNSLTSWDKNKSASENWARRTNAALWLAAIMGLMKILINGDRVLLKRVEVREQSTI